MEETIQLKIETPVTRVEALDKTIAKLKELDAVSQSLHGRKIHVDVVSNLGKFRSELIAAASLAKRGFLVNPEVQTRKAAADGKKQIDEIKKRMQSEVPQFLNFRAQLDERSVQSMMRSVDEIIASTKKRSREAAGRFNPTDAQNYAEQASAMEAAFGRVRKDLGLPAAEVGAETAAKLTQAEKALAASSGKSDAALGKQDETVRAKAGSMAAAATSAGSLADKEKRLATASKESERAIEQSRKQEEALIRTRRTGQRLTSEEFATGDGSTVRRDYRKGGMVIESSEVDRVKQARAEVARLNAEFKNTIDLATKQGAGGNVLSRHHEEWARSLDKVAKSYQDLERLGATNIGAQAERQRISAAGALAAQGRRDRPLALRNEVGALSTNAAAQLQMAKAQGVQGRELAKIYDAYGASLDVVAKKYAAMGDSGAVAVSRLAERQRGLAKSTVAAQDTRDAKARAEAEAKAERQVFERGVRDQKTMRQRARAERTMDEFSSTGYAEQSRTTRRNSKTGGVTETVTFERESASMKESARVVIERDRAGRVLNATTQETSRLMKETGDAARYSSKNFLTNTANVALWASSVAALYGSLALAGKGLRGLMEIEQATAILTQVFRGGEAEALRLRDGVLSLGAAYGRSSKEALDAAVRFSRIGMTRAEVLEATAVALKAANVAEIDSATAAEQLSSIYAAYGLRVSDLRVVLNELNTVSNKYNATNKDMLNGIARTSGIAKQAGLGLNELIGIIGSGVGRTGRSGSEFGNAVKSIIVALSNPAMQTKLKDSFNFDTLDSNGEIKNFSDILGELTVKYNELSNAEKQAMVQMVAGKMQASRMTVMLDGYVQSQVLAIQANRDLSSAESENAKIRATMQSQLTGLTTQFEGFVAAMMGANKAVGFSGVLSGTIELLKNLLSLMTVLPDATAIFVAILGFLAVRMAMVTMRAAGGAQATGFFGRTCQEAARATSVLKAALMEVVFGYKGVTAAAMEASAAQRAAAAGGGGAVAPKAAVAAGGGAAASRGVGAALGGLLGFGKTLLATAGWGIVLYGVMEAINLVFRTFSDGTEAANARLAGFNDELERTRGMADAAGRTAKLGETLAKMASNPRVNREQLAENLDLFDQVNGAPDDQRGQLAQMARMGEFGRLQARLGEIIGKQKADQVQQSREAVMLESRMLTDLQKQLAARERLLRARGQDLFADDQYKNLFNRVQEQSGKAMKTASDSMVDDEMPASTGEDPKAKSMDAYLAARMAAVDRIEAAMPKLNEAQQTQSEIAALAEKRAELDGIVKLREDELAVAQRALPAEPKIAVGVEQYDKARAKQTQIIVDLLDARKMLEDAESGSSMASISSQGLGGAGVKDFSTRKMLQARDRIKELEEEANRFYDSPDAQVLKDTAGNTREEIEAAEKIRGIRAAGIEAAASEISMLKEKTAEQKRALDLAELELKTKLQTAQIEDAIARGKREGALGSVRFQDADTSGENLVRERRGLIAPAGMREQITGIPLNIRAAQDDLRNARTSGGKGDPVAEARAIAQLKTMAARVDAVNFDIVARKLALEVEITKEKRRQVEESSKNVLMASREEQLNAAAAAAFSKKRGGKAFSAEEFQYLDQNTRQGIQQFNPNLLPKEISSTKSQETEYNAVTAELKRVMALQGLQQEEMMRIFNERIQSMGANATTGLELPASLQNIDTSAAAAQINSVGSMVQRALSSYADTVVSNFTGIYKTLDAQAARISSLSRGSVAAATGRAQGAGTS